MSAVLDNPPLAPATDAETMRAAVREIADGALAELADDIDRRGVYPKAVLQRLGEVEQSMRQATDNYTLLVEKSGVFTNVAAELSSLLRTLNDDRARLQNVSAELAKLLVSAQGSLPQVEQKVLALTDQLTNSVIENQKRIGIALTDNATAIRNSIQSANESMSSAHKQQVSQITELVEKTKQQVTILDKALSEELEKSLNSLGRQLTALSERFVADYEPLTKALKRLVDIGS